MPPAQTGVVIVTHGQHGLDMLKAAEAIVGEIQHVKAVGVAVKEEMKQTTTKIRSALYSVDDGVGVLFLVDLHGSTPANICLSFMDGAHDTEVLCGLNMAMLIKLVTCDRRSGPRKLAELLCQTGKRSIRLGSEITGQVEKIEP